MTGRRSSRKLGCMASKRCRRPTTYLQELVLLFLPLIPPTYLPTYLPTWKPPYLVHRKSGSG
eukprot:9568212-Prorocentrum_lima.AAC.1